MSKYTNPASPLGELFIDATREVLEKGRIKAQMVRLERIMEADRTRKNCIYAEIGRMYVDGSIAKNKGRLSYALKAIKHIDLRLERAEARYNMLKEAHSLDECTDAFRTGLSKKINQAKDSVAITAYGVKKKAKKVTSGIGEKASDSFDGIKSAAGTVIKGVSKTKKKSTKATNFAEDDKTKNFTALLEELEIAETETEVEENTELNAVLDNIDAILREVEEEVAEESLESPAAQDGETAETFDF